MKKILLICCFVALLASCRTTSKNANSGYYKYETECMGADPDGTQRVKGYGKAQTRAEAIEQAKKNAVKDVIFKGITYGKTDCAVKPIVFDPNLLDRQDAYFRKFFADGGEYSNYITTKGEDAFEKEKKKAGHDVTYGVTITVDRDKIRQKLISDNIINP